MQANNDSIGRGSFGLSGNLLKLIAALTMLVDHTGMILFPNVLWLRIIGRLSFPIFAFLIAEGCRHTKNRLRYLSVIFCLGVVTTAVYYMVEGRLYGNILITFSCSIAICFCLLRSGEAETRFRKGLWLFVALFLTLSIWQLDKHVLHVDYGILGVMLPVFPTAVDLLVRPKKRLAMLTPRFWGFVLGLFLLCFMKGWLQLFALPTSVLLAFYNGERGFRIPKYAFYVFYPLHLDLLWIIEMLMAKA